MSAYKVVSSIRFTDAQGYNLDIILESNGVSWKLFARHRLLGGDPRESGWENFPTEEQGRQEFQHQVKLAEEMGWKSDQA